MAGLLSKELSRFYKVFLLVNDASQRVYTYEGTLICLQEIQKQNNISYCEALSRVKEEQGIDVSISFLAYYNFANIRTRGKDKIIISERNAQSRFEPRARYIDRIEKEYYGFADVIVACSEGVKYNLSSEYGIKQRLIHTIYNYVEQSSIRDMSGAGIDDDIASWLNGADFFLNIGRLHPQKQQGRLIRQFALFHETDRNNMKLVIIGSGILEEKLKEMIREYCMQDYILLVPYLNNPFPYIRESKCVILSSHHEGLPNVLLEAMTIGRPIIAIDCLAGPRELLDDEGDYSLPISDNKVCKRGVLVPDADTDDSGKTEFLARAMKWILTNEEKCDQFVNAQLLYMSHYDNKRITEEWIELIEATERKDNYIPERENRLLSNADQIYIYGAGKRGKSIFNRLNDKYNITAFIVSDGQDSASYENEIPIKQLSDVNVADDNTVVILGVGALYADEVVKQLEEHRVKNLIILGD
ncbi:MAG: glycosyltransferase [Lachnospiraceae bacterium]|nr:glycosyltransferase [Lachnospiraceae bacterium]